MTRPETLMQTATPPVLEQTALHDTEVPLPVLEMVQPLAGFPDRRRFALARLDETGLVCDLRSLDDPDLSFVVVPPGPFFADYSPVIDASVTDELGLEDENDLLARVVVTLGDTPEQATANLLAPVLVNHRTQRAGQYVLSDADLPMRAPLSGASSHRSA
jgi:flagellar assembly factor FliW